MAEQNPVHRTVVLVCISIGIVITMFALLLGYERLNHPSSKLTTNVKATEIDLSMPTATGAVKSVLESLVEPYARAFVAMTGSSGTLTLEKKSVRLFPVSSINITLPPSKDPVLLHITTTNPAELMQRMFQGVVKWNPALAEGLKSITEEQLRTFTGHTDISTAAKDLFARPTALEITKNNRGIQTLLTGQMVSAARGTEWMHALQAKASPASIRQQSFFGENSRTDIVAKTAVTEPRNENGWMITDLGGSGSTLQLFVATKSLRWILSTDEESLLRTAHYLDTPAANSQNLSFSEGIIDIGWLREAVITALPFLTEDLPTLSQTHLSWSATDNGSSVVIPFTFSFPDGSSGKL